MAALSSFETGQFVKARTQAEIATEGTMDRSCGRQAKNVRLSVSRRSARTGHMRSPRMAKEG